MIDTTTTRWEFRRSINTTECAYEAVYLRAGYVAPFGDYVALVYRPRADRRLWRATSTRGTYPTRLAAAEAALAQRID